MEVQASKEREVYYRMMGVLERFGFSKLGSGDEDSELYGLIDDGVTRVVIIARRAMTYMHDPITAVVIHNGEHKNTCYNSQGLYDVLKYDLKLEQVPEEA
jgi:hypothetical protein